MEKEKNSRRYGSCFDEKGMVSASSLDSNLGDFEGSFSGKYMGFVFPTFRSSIVKKTCSEGSMCCTWIGG